MKFSISLAAVAALIPSAFAHVSMDFPKSFVGGQDIMSPLAADGSNYPCMAPNYNLDSQLTIQPGESGQITLSSIQTNAAPHGGGSCQISLTYDKAPNAGSRFTVIKSIEGGCPVVAAGNEVPGPYFLSYTIPEDAPAGNAVLAWTWFNKLGGQGEMYMRCSPITIGGSNSDISAFSSARPEIFKANIGSAGNGCKTTPGSDLKFPNPGPVLVGQGTGAPDCGSSGTPVAPQPSSSVAKPSTTATATATPSPVLPGNGNGPVIKLPSPVTPPVAESPAETPATPVESETPEAPVETEEPVEDEKPVAEKPVAEKPVAEKPVEDEKPVVAKPVSPPAGVAPETPVAAPSKPPSKDATPCNKPGAIVCTSDSTFSICNHGFLTKMGNTARGTKCVDGKITRRSYPIRLTGHLRRRHGKF